MDDAGTNACFFTLLPCAGMIAAIFGTVRAQKDTCCDFLRLSLLLIRK